MTENRSEQNEFERLSSRERNQKLKKLYDMIPTAAFFLEDPQDIDTETVNIFESEETRRNKRLRKLQLEMHVLKIKGSAIIDSAADIFSEDEEKLRINEERKVIAESYRRLLSATTEYTTDSFRYVLAWKFEYDLEVGVIEFGSGRKEIELFSYIFPPGSEEGIFNPESARTIERNVFKHQLVDELKKGHVSQRLVKWKQEFAKLHNDEP